MTSVRQWITPFYQTLLSKRSNKLHYFNLEIHVNTDNNKCTK